MEGDVVHPAVKVSRKNGERARYILARAGMLSQEYRMNSDEDYVYLPLTQSLTQSMTQSVGDYGGRGTPQSVLMEEGIKA